MKAALYTRVSTDMQVEEGFSLDAQLSRLRAYCESQGWEIYDLYTDEGLSAKDTKRPGLQRMLEHIKEKRFDVVLVYKLDRLTRNVVDLHRLIQEFERHGVAFKSATEVFDTTSAMGRLFITIVAALAQWERENLGERVRMGQVEKVQQGKRSGAQAPFGYRYAEGQLVPDEPAAEVVREIFTRYLRGDGTVKLLRWLNDKSNPQPAPTSGRWSQNTLKYVLENAVYAGYVRYGHNSRSKVETITERGDHDPLLEESIWKQVQQLRQKRRSIPPRAGTGTYPFTGVLQCGRCGAALIGKAKGLQAGRRYYLCSERNSSRTCDLPYIPEKRLEDTILDEIDKRYHERKTVKPKQQKKVHRKKSLDADLARIEQRRKRWKDAYEDGMIEAEEMRERLDALQEQEMAIRAQSAEVEEGIDTTEMELAILANFRQQWENADIQEKRQIVSLLIRNVTVYSATEITIAFA